MSASHSAIESSEDLSKETQQMERILFGLRMNEGVDVPSLEKKFGCTLNQDQHDKIGIFIKEDFLVRQGPQLTVSAKGRLVLDELSVQLMPA